MVPVKDFSEPEPIQSRHANISYDTSNTGKV